MIPNEFINWVKLYFMVGALVFLIIRSAFFHISRFSISGIQLSLLGSFILVLIHAMLFSEDFSKSGLVVIGLLWLLIGLLAHRNYGKILLFRSIDRIFFVGGIYILGVTIVSILFVQFDGLLEVGNFKAGFENANSLAIIPSVFLCSYYLGKIDVEGGRSKRLVYIFLLFLSFILLVSTRSRTGLIAVLLTSSIYFLFVRKLRGDPANQRFKKLVYLVAVVSVTVFLIIGGDLIYKYDGEDIFSTRSHLVELRLVAINERPLTGWGFSVNNFTYLDEFNKFNSGEKGNTFLEILEEFGLIFGSLFIVFIGYLYYHAIATSIRSSVFKPYALVLISSTIALQGETWLFNFYGLPGLSVWMLLFLLSASDRSVNESHK